MKEVKKRKRCMNKLKDSSNPSRCLNNVTNLNSSYPFLTLLGGICSLIQKNNVKENSEINAKKDFKSVYELVKLEIPSVDNELYPYSSLLQAFIEEANLNKLYTEEKVETNENLFLIMRSLAYPIDIPSSSHVDDEKELNSMDFSYSSRLKDIAYQSERHEIEDRTLTFKNPDIDEIRFVLQNIFPERGIESENMIYSKKLKEISENVVREEEEFMDSETHLSQSCYQGFREESDTNRGSLIITENKIKQELNNACRIKNNCDISPNYITLIKDSSHCSNQVRDNQNIAKNFASKNTRNEKELFEALMSNIQLQSMINHSNNDSENSSTIKSETSVREYTSDDGVDDTGVSLVENFLFKHLQNKWEV